MPGSEHSRDVNRRSRSHAPSSRTKISVTASRRSRANDAPTTPRRGATSPPRAPMLSETMSRNLTSAIRQISDVTAGLLATPTRSRSRSRGASGRSSRMFDTTLNSSLTSMSFGFGGSDEEKKDDQSHTPSPNRLFDDLIAPVRPHKDRNAPLGQDQGNLATASTMSSTSSPNRDFSGVLHSSDEDTASPHGTTSATSSTEERAKCRDQWKRQLKIAQEKKEQERFKLEGPPRGMKRTGSKSFVDYVLSMSTQCGAIDDSASGMRMMATDENDSITSHNDSPVARSSLGVQADLSYQHQFPQGSQESWNASRRKRATNDAPSESSTADTFANDDNQPCNITMLLRDPSDDDIDDFVDSDNVRRPGQSDVFGCRPDRSTALLLQDLTCMSFSTAPSTPRTTRSRIPKRRPPRKEKRTSPAASVQSSSSGTELDQSRHNDDSFRSQNRTSVGARTEATHVSSSDYTHEKSVPSSTATSDVTPLTDLTTTMHNKSSHGKSYITTFIRNLATQGTMLHWHSDPQSPTSIPITLRLRLGQLEPSGCHGAPRLAWTTPNGDLYDMSILDIRALARASRAAMVAYPYAMPSRSIHMSASHSSSYILEAESEAEATTFIHGMRWIIARFAFNCVIGNVDVCCEMLDLGDGPSPSRSTKAMNDMANQLVDSCMLR